MTPKHFAVLNRCSPLWAIQPEAVLMAFGVADLQASGWEASKPSTQGRGDNKVVTIPVQGVLTKDGPSWYGSNYDSMTTALENAAADPSVKHIVLSVDSPGGDVMGLKETAAKLAEVAKAKPVTAVVEGRAASAAYYLASQARDIVLTPSGEVGSVGVRLMHFDYSKMLENQGVKVTEMFAGDHKTDWSPFKPLSDEAKADEQPRLDAAHAEFLSAVDSGRGDRATAEIKANRFGEGRMFSADAALGHGLVDKIQPSRDAYRALAPKAEDVPPAHGFTKSAKAHIDIARKRA